MIGAGITGPAAALALTRAGHDVTVYERRPQNDVWSPGIIRLTESTIRRTAHMGVDISQIVVNPPSDDYRAMASPERRVIHSERYFYPEGYHAVIWGDLHNALVLTGKRRGVQYRFDTDEPSEFDYDVTIHAAGIGYAAHKLASGKQTAQYLGYSAFRGNTINRTRYEWTSLHHKERKFILNLAQTRTGTHFIFYIPEDSPPNKTVNVTNGRADHMYNYAYEYLPTEYNLFLHELYTPIQATPMYHWTMPELIRWRGENFGGHGQHIDIGDAIAPVSPHTAQGANLGLWEGYTLPSALSGPEALKAWANRTKAHRATQLQRGLERAQAWMETRI